MSDIPVPPEELRHCAGKSYKVVGRNWLRILTDLGGLRPDENVLDIGCGVGRVAVPLTSYMNDRGAYEGFDVGPKGIAWCQENITSKYPNFRFQLADIYNADYNPKSKQKTHEYRFPYQDEHFDLVFMASVFTHFLPEEMEHYLLEISRVLKQGGRCVISYFLLNEASIKRIEAGKLNPSRLSFAHDCGTYRLQNKQVPRVAVAYDEHAVRAHYQQSGLRMIEPVHYGRWAGRKSGLSINHNQDIVLATKSENLPH